MHGKKEDPINDPVGEIPIAGEAYLAEPPPPANETTVPDSSPSWQKPQPVWPEKITPGWRRASSRRQRHRFTNYLFWPGLLGAIMAFLYLAAALVVFPLVAPKLFSHYLEKKLDRPVTIARGEWRPLAGRLVLHNGIVGPRKADPFDRVDPLLSFRTLTLDGSLTLLLRRGRPWAAMTVQQGYVHLVRDEEQLVNFAAPMAFAGSRWFPRVLTFHNSRLEFSDRHQTPLFNLELSDFSGKLELNRGGGLAFTLAAHGPAASELTLQGMLPATGGDSGRAELTLHDLPLSSLAAYLEPRLAGTIQGGLLNGSNRFVTHNGTIIINQQLIISALELAPATDDDHTLPLLQALLTNRQQQLPLELAVSLNPAEPDNGYLHQLTAKLNQWQAAAADEPFALLARELPDLAFTRQITFTAGSSSLNREGGRQLDQMAAALNRRPLLALHLQGISDFTCDRQALQEKREQAVRQQRRQAVAALTRQLTGEEPGDDPHLSSPLTEFRDLRPGSITVGRDELRELAVQRRDTVHQRLQAALEEDGQARLIREAPLLAPPAVDEQTCVTAVNLRLGYRPTAAQ
ncbi:DUF748 domain-containing protein [Desulfurivibrio dismutans]|uniref:DUF748 domain-containing protein n=1 Tax=Desulfurivibrio dismutans TaxID=1398908 RepID=UPI0023DC10DB|nr:DUF748 domain-containing protein [Desulfurivibrio alkaliphilus]MDF1614538.1 DUF748 domain-containing protein [Desulfurivibrio alkaliphilus]